MGNIKKLSQHVINRIAAGEVIERPVFAVKELVENAIDANADIIRIQIDDSGLKKINVSDNGCGMDQADVLAAIKPHTTSKLIDDTFSGIKSLGFRGEALASIAAVSSLLMQSRNQETTSGHFVHVLNGEIIDYGPIGMPIGTQVSVQNLFNNTPARKKFLKSKRTEFAHIVDLITKYALVNLHIKFTLVHNNRIIFDLPKNQMLQDRIEKLLGKSISTHLLPLSSDPDYLTITGMIAHPQLASRSQNKQFIFVNKRVVSDKVISLAAKEAYSNLLEQTQYPIFILFLSIPHEAVDVNIHPRKEQISFVNHAYVFDTVKQVLSKNLTDNNLTFQNLSFFPTTRKGTTLSHTAELLRENVDPWSIKDTTQIISTEIFQLHATYLLIQTKQGMVLIDQHAAHERILFEQYKHAFLQEKKYPASTELLHPVTFELSISDAELIEEHMHLLSQIGFRITHITKNSYTVTAVPAIFKDRNIQPLILELLENIQTEGNLRDLDHISNTTLAFLACRTAVMAGEKLTKQEAKKLLEKLELTQNNATCPHGRPTKIVVSINNVHKMFKRM